jgi:hypothetical protein
VLAVSWLPCSETSATTTLAPSRANASAVVRPMPLPAPVTNAALPAKLAVWFVAGIMFLAVAHLRVVVNVWVMGEGGP